MIIFQWLFEAIFYLIVLSMCLILTVIVVTRFLTELTGKLLTIVDGVREIVKTIALDSIQVWSSGQMSLIDIDREHSKLEYAQDLSTLRLYEYRNAARKRLETQNEEN